MKKSFFKASRTPYLLFYRIAEKKILNAVSLHISLNLFRSFIICTNFRAHDKNCQNQFKTDEQKFFITICVVYYYFFF